MENNAPKAKIDGREIPIEIVGEETRKKESKDFFSFRISPWRAYLPFIIGGLALTGIIILSITLFIWALPVLFPLIFIIFIFRLFNKS